MFTYTEDQVDNLKKIYPVGATVETYLATPRKSAPFEVLGEGKIINVDRQGVHAEVYDTHAGRDFVQILRPTHDRFQLKHPSGARALTQMV